MDCQIRPFSIPLESPVATATGRIESRDGYLVRIEADRVAGVGEATPLPGWTEPLTACLEALESGVERVATDGLGPTLAGMSGTPAARHGLALAREDREAKLEGHPLYRSLGAGEAVESVPVNATIGTGTVDETVTAATSAVEAGYPCLKLKVGAASVDGDLTRLSAVRGAVGPDVALRADANGSWGRKEAEEALPALAEVGVEYVEQPLPPDDLEGLAALRGGPVEIAIDESLATHSPGDVIEAGAADRLILKPMVLGGLDRARSAAAIAAGAGVRSVVTTTIDAVVARTGAVHLGGALDDSVPAGLATAGLLAEDLAGDPAPVDDGRIRVPQAAGHGVEIPGWHS